MKEASEKPLRIVLADDHPIFLIGLRAVLERDERLTIVGEANSPKPLPSYCNTAPVTYWSPTS